jgi:hypothetical protein
VRQTARLTGAGTGRDGGTPNARHEAARVHHAARRRGAWPLSVQAQQPERARRIGVLMHLAADDPEGQARIGPAVCTENQILQYW